ncbi:MAG: sigma-70 family RNA polymerase sigma factor [Isosphaerales bacterium]
MASVRSTTAMATQLGTLYSLGAVGSLPDDQLVERYLARDDLAASEAAFTALVDRHGAMVLSVCQRLLQNPHDAHDAFQATFLVLVRKAASIRRRESVGGWLFGIARRVAARARLQAARRRRHNESMFALRTVPGVQAIDEAAGEPERDYGPLIAEIDRLPEQFRMPVVLHYFEGLSTEVTAQRLGCPRGTVLSRLARARERLRRRLEERGVALEALMPATAASGRLFSSVTVPSTLVHTTVRAAASLSLAGAAIENVVPTTVAALSGGVIRSLMFAKVRLASVVVILSMATAAIGLTMAASANGRAQRGSAKTKSQSQHPQTLPIVSPPKTGEKQASDSLVIRGRVFDPDGKPAAGAQIVLGLPVTGPFARRSPERLSSSGADGRFEAPIPRKVIERPGADQQTPFPGPVLAALAPGLGPDWVAVDSKNAGETLNLRLRRDDIPIEGRVIGLEGRPLPGLTVSVDGIAEFPAELIKRLRENAGAMNPALWGGMRNALILGKDGPIPAVHTNSDGRFRLTGVGRDRVALVLIEGESIEQSVAMVMTTSNPAYTPLLLPADGSGERKLFGPRFDLTVDPGRVIQGVIRDGDTGRPVSGAKVRSWAIGMTTSDTQGRFSIAGQPKRGGNIVEVITDGQPYIKVDKPIGDPPGLEPIHVDVTLKRGVWVLGKVTDRANGRPVKAIVQYYPFRDNPHLKECPDASFLDNNVSNETGFPTDASGRFHVVALSGGGILTVVTTEPGYLTAKPLSPKDAGNVLHAANFEIQMTQYQALVPINPGAVEKMTIPDIAVVPGRTQHVQVIGPAGRPVAGARFFGRRWGPTGREVSSGAEFTFVHPKPGTDEPVLVVQQDEAAGGFLLIKGGEPDPIRISLQPTGTITGRLVDEEGRPRPNVSFVVMQDLTTTRFERFSDQTKTGPDGRFRIKGLVPGVSYDVEAINNNTTNYSDRFLGHIHKSRWTVKPGETHDWGDVQVKKYMP